MNPFIRLAVLLLFLAPGAVFAQSMVGTWQWDDTMDGTTVTFSFEVKADGTWTVDVGNDGSVELSGVYTLDGDQMTITETGEGSPCSGVAGLYKMTITETTATASVISDKCDQRRGDGSDLVMTRVN